MFTRRPALVATLMLTALTAVSACAAVETPPEAESYVSDTETSAPVAETPGPLEPDTTAGAEVPLCRQDKFFNSAGNGGIAIGIPQDTLETGSVGASQESAEY